MNNENPLQTTSNEVKLAQPPEWRNNGKFAPGNRIAKGNGFSRKIMKFRAAMFASVSRDDIKAIVGQLITQARAGEGWAIKLSLEYLVGNVADLAMEERLALLEQALAQPNQTLVVQNFTDR